jgi:hypothetical protein
LLTQALGRKVVVLDDAKQQQENHDTERYAQQPQKNRHGVLRAEVNNFGQSGEPRAERKVPLPATVGRGKSA